MTAAQVADKLEQCARQNRLTHTMFLTTHQRCIAQQVIVCCGTPPHRIMGGGTPMPSAACFSFYRTIWMRITSRKRSCPLELSGSAGAMARRLPIRTSWAA